MNQRLCCSTVTREACLVLLLVWPFVPIALAQSASQQQISPKEKRDRTLIQAVATKNLPLVQALLRQGADPNALGGAPLSYALIGWDDPTHKSTRIIKMLLRYGADVNPRRNAGHPPFDPPLTAAAQFQSVAIMKLLLDRGANSNARDDRGWTALMLTRGRDTDAKVRLLLKRGAKVNARADDSTTALFSAAAVDYYSPATLRLLLQKGADVNVRATDGETALMLAAQDGTSAREDPGAIAKVKLLRASGADINAMAKDGNTALSYAIKSKHSQIAQLLRNWGARR